MASNREVEVEVLTRLFEQEWISARQMADHRSQITNFIIVISSAIIGLIAQKEVLVKPILLNIFLIIIGLYGTVVSFKYYERFKYHVARAKKYRGKIEELTCLPLNGLMRQQQAVHEDKYSTIHKVPVVREVMRLYRIWLMLPMLITCFGFVLLFYSTSHNFAQKSVTKNVYFTVTVPSGKNNTVNGRIYSEDF